MYGSNVFNSISKRAIAAQTILFIKNLDVLRNLKLSVELLINIVSLGSTHKVQVNPGRSLFDWAMKPFALRRLGHHIV